MSERSRYIDELVERESKAFQDACPHTEDCTDYEVGSGSSFNVYCKRCDKRLSGPHA